MWVYPDGIFVVYNLVTIVTLVTGWLDTYLFLYTLRWMYVHMDVQHINPADNFHIFLTKQVYWSIYIVCLLLTCICMYQSACVGLPVCDLFNTQAHLGQCVNLP